MDFLCGLTGSLVLTVLYLADRSKTMDLLCWLTGSLVLRNVNLLLLGRLCIVCLLRNDLLLNGLNSILTVLYLTDRSRLVNLLCGLTGSLILSVLCLVDRSSVDPIIMDPTFTLTIRTGAPVRAVLPS